MGRSIELARVFYRVEAETKGLDQQLKSAEKSFDRLGKFVLANPVAAAGALGVALLGAAAKATQMAEEIEKGFRRLQAVVPGMVGSLKQAQDGVAAIARETGRSQNELLATAEVIGRNGVKNTEDLLNRLRTVTNLARVTGTETGLIAAGLDQVLDVFGLAADKADEAGARLFAIAKGKAPLEDLFAALQGAAPGIRAAGLSFDVAAQALGTLLDEGRSPKQAATQLKELAAQGAKGRAELERLAGAAVQGATAFGELDTAIADVADTAPEKMARLAQVFETWAVRVGRALEPVKSTLLDILVQRFSPGSSLGFTATGSGSDLDATIADAMRRLNAAINGTGAGGSAFSTGGPVQLTPEEIAAIAERKKRYTELLTDLQRQQAELTATLIDDSLLATDRFLAEMKAKLDGLSKAEQAALQPLIDQIVAGMQHATQLLRDAESFRVSVSPLGVNTGGRVLGGGKAIGTDPAVQKAKEETKAENDLAKARREAIQSASAHAQQIEQAARGALQLAEALGGMSAEAAQAAEAVVQIGAAAAQLGELSKSGTLDFSSGFSSVLSIFGALSSLFSSLFGGGPSPAEQQRAADNARQAELLAKNNDAIAELNRKIGDLGQILGSTSGSDVLAASQAARASLADPHYFEPRAEIAKAGLSLAEFTAIANALGITFKRAVPNADELRQVIEAIASSELATYSQTFTGQLQEIQDIFAVFNITDPLEQLRKLVELFNDPKFGSPALRKALAGLDLSTPEGRAAAEKAIQELVKRLGLTPDQGGISLADLGGLSPEEFRQALLDLAKRLQDLGQTSGPQGETQGFAVSRTITEAQGSAVISQLGSVVYWQQALYELLDHRMLQPPNIIPGALSGGGASITLTIYQSFDSQTTVAKATELGNAAADATVKRLNGELGASLRTRKLLAGDVTRV